VYSTDDLTARARIRDAALRLFAERGVEGATIRDIAAEAGVSSGLVRHHFGSKDALRDACDTYATDWMNRVREQMLAEGRLADQTFMAAAHPTVMLMQNYLMRSMMDGSDTAATMFEDMVRLSEEWLADHRIESTDRRAHAAVIVAMQMGVFLMRDQMSRVLGEDLTSPAGHVRMTRALLDAFTTPLLDPDQAAQARTALDRFEPPTKE
jgi:AcrR family transcriptional regulator